MLTTIVASCALKTPASVTPFEIKVKLEGHNFPRLEIKLSKCYMKELQAVYAMVQLQNKSFDETHQVVTRDKDKIGEEFQARLINLQVRAYNFLRSPGSQPVDTLTMIRLKDIIRGLRATFIGDNWEAYAAKFPRQFLEMAVDRYEHLSKFHVNVLETMAAREAQITIETLELQVSLSEHCKHLSPQERLSLFEQLMEHGNSKRLRLRSRQAEATENPEIYHRGAEDECRKVAVFLDFFQVTHIMETFPKQLQWRLNLVLKSFYSFLLKNPEYDRLYITSCARALLKGYQHLQMYHLDIVSKQQEVMQEIQEKYDRLVEFLGDSPDKEGRKAELERQRDKKIKKIGERVELAALNPADNRTSAQSKIDVILERIRMLLEFKTVMDEKLEGDLKAIIDNQRLQLAKENLVTQTLVLGSSSSSFRKWKSSNKK